MSSSEFALIVCLKSTLWEFYNNCLYNIFFFMKLEIKANKLFSLVPLAGSHGNTQNILFL